MDSQADDRFPYVMTLVVLVLNTSLTAYLDQHPGLRRAVWTHNGSAMMVEVPRKMDRGGGSCSTLHKAHIAVAVRDPTWECPITALLHGHLIQHATRLTCTPGLSSLNSSRPLSVHRPSPQMLWEGRAKVRWVN